VHSTADSGLTITYWVATGQFSSLLFRRDDVNDTDGNYTQPVYLQPSLLSSDARMYTIMNRVDV